MAEKSKLTSKSCQRESKYTEHRIMSTTEAQKNTVTNLF